MENNGGVDFRSQEQRRRDELGERLNQVGDYVMATRVLFDECYQQTGWGGLLGKKETFSDVQR